MYTTIPKKLIPTSIISTHATRTTTSTSTSNFYSSTSPHTFSSPFSPTLSSPGINSSSFSTPQQPYQYVNSMQYFRPKVPSPTQSFFPPTSPISQSSSISSNIKMPSQSAFIQTTNPPPTNFQTANRASITNSTPRLPSSSQYTSHDSSKFHTSLPPTILTTTHRAFSSHLPVPVMTRAQFQQKLRQNLHTHQRSALLAHQLFPGSHNRIPPLSSQTSSKLPYTVQKRHLFGVVQNMRHMNWDRLSDHWKHPFVWLEEYKLGRYRADKKRIVFHARRTGGIQPPFDHLRGEYMDEWEYLELLKREREERFRRYNIWRKATVLRRFALHTVITRVISGYNNIQDRITRIIGWSTLKPRGLRHKERRFWRYMFFLPIRFPMQLLLRILGSFFLRIEMTRIWALQDLDFHMQNRVSGELFAKFKWPVKYSFSKYLVALYEPMFNTFNYFHGVRLVVLNVIWPLIQRWWHHINNYKPYLGFMKFGALQFFLCSVLGAWTSIMARFQWFDHATYSYKADFAHTYIALMTRAVYADVLIALVEDGLIQVDPLTEGHDFEMHTKMKSAEFKYVDDEVQRRCDEDPEYRDQLRKEGIPVTLDEFYGIDGIPIHATPKDQVLYILRQYNDYSSITKSMLSEMRPLKQFIEKYLRILYSLGLSDEISWLNRLMGNISSPKTFLYAYRALINVIGTRDGDTDDPSVQHHAMIRAITRKFDLTIVPPSLDHVKTMSVLNRPYALQFQNTPWDKWAMLYDAQHFGAANKFVDDRPSMNLDVYHGADKSSYDPIKHGEHQFFNNLPSVTNGYNSKGNHDGIGNLSDINLKGLGKAFFDPYVSILLPSYHARPLDHEMIVLQQIKEDLISFARMHPEYKNNIPLEYDPYGYKHYIQAYLRVYGSAKLQTWEKMLGRDFFFETPDLTTPTHDIPMQKHAKWLWATVLSCVTEKVENHWFASPMYYIEGTCPDLEKSPYRSKVDTISRYIYRNKLGRPTTEFQRRGIDYQMIDPYAEENVSLMKRFKFNSNQWDFKNFNVLDPRIDEMYKSPGEDMGYWPGGKSHLPFLGINKYRGANAMTGYIGMLVTASENLMTVNRTAKDVMIKTGTDEKYKKAAYDPFGPQYRHSDGSYENYPDGDERYTVNRDSDNFPSTQESDPIIHAKWSNKSIIPTYSSLRSAEILHDSYSSPNAIALNKQMDNRSFQAIANSIATRESGQQHSTSPSSPSSQASSSPAGLHSLPDSLLTISRYQRSMNSNIHELRENEQELLYRLQDKANSFGNLAAYHQIQRNISKIHSGSEYFNPENQLQSMLAQNGASSEHFDHHRIPPEFFEHDLKPLVDKYNKALELHHQDPFSYPHPLPVRQPFDKQAYKANSKSEDDRF